MAKSPQQKDEALEALDFIVNILKEHERDLDKLIRELATVTEQMGDTSQLSSKVEKVDEKISGLKIEVTNLIGCISAGSKAAPPATAPPVVSTEVEAVTAGSSVVLRCKQWEDFQALASHAQNVSFNYKETEKVLQADALKGNQIIVYNGPLPRFPVVIKAFLAKQLDVSEQCIIEGGLALG